MLEWTRRPSQPAAWPGLSRAATQDRRLHAPPRRDLGVAALARRASESGGDSSPRARPTGGARTSDIRPQQAGTLVAVRLRERCATVRSRGMARSHRAILGPAFDAPIAHDASGAPWGRPGDDPAASPLTDDMIRTATEVLLPP